MTAASAGDFDFLAGEPEMAAPRLLGAHLVSTVDDQTVRVRITEVEAYKGEDDPASHAYRGRTDRNDSMFNAPGTLYVYKSYGVHNCANTATGPIGTGWGILIRGAEVIDGEGIVRRRRRRNDELVNGPGKLCEALGIDIEHNGTDLLSSQSQIRLESGQRPEMVLSTPRIGISKAKDRPWRFVAATAARPT
jgi:DNA-3-methyladenine glycosylase